MWWFIAQPYKNPTDCFVFEGPTVSVVDFKIEFVVHTKRKKKNTYIAIEEMGAVGYSWLLITQNPKGGKAILLG